MFGKKVSWGLDIGTGAIKLVGFKPGKRKGELELVSAQNIVLDRGLPHDEAVLKVLRDLLAADKKIKSGRLVTSVSGQSVFVRYMNLPRVPDRKMAQIIKYEAQQQVPFPIEEVAWDYQVFSQGDSPEVGIILIAVKKDIVEAILTPLSKNKLTVEYIDTTSLSLYNTLNFFYKGDEGLVVLDIGCKSTNIIIIEKGRMWTRSVPVAGNDITESLVSNLNVDFAKAEELKKENGLILIAGDAENKNIPHAREISRAIAVVLTDILTEISRSISFYKSQYSQAQIKNILILGGSSYIKNIDKFFEKNLDLKSIKIDFLQGVTVPGRIAAPSLETDLNIMGVAFGQALRGLENTVLNINLMPPEILKAREFKKKKAYIFLSGIIAILIVVTVGLFTFQENRMDKEGLASLSRDVGQLETYQNTIKEIEKEMQPITKKINTLMDISQRRSFWLRVLLEVSKILPRETWLTSFESNPAEEMQEETPTHSPFPEFLLTIKGETTGQLSSIVDLKEVLRKSDYFDEVEILYANFFDVSAAASTTTTAIPEQTGRGSRRRAAVTQPGILPVPAAAAKPEAVKPEEKRVGFSIQMIIMEKGEKQGEEKEERQKQREKQKQKQKERPDVLPLGPFGYPGKPPKK